MKIRCARARARVCVLRAGKWVKPRIKSTSCRDGVDDEGKRTRRGAGGEE